VVLFTAVDCVEVFDVPTTLPFWLITIPVGVTNVCELAVVETAEVGAMIVHDGQLSSLSKLVPLYEPDWTASGHQSTRETETTGKETVIVWDALVIVKLWLATPVPYTLMKG
jgi:hypothetical protein